jgi:hypothetical protein
MTAWATAKAGKAKAGGRSRVAASRNGSLRLPKLRVLQANGSWKLPPRNGSLRLPKLRALRVSGSWKLPPHGSVAFAT